MEATTPAHQTVNVEFSTTCSSVFTRQTNTIIAELVEVLNEYGKNVVVRNIANLQRDVKRIMDAGKLKHIKAGVTAD